MAIIYLGNTQIHRIHRIYRIYTEYGYRVTNLNIAQVKHKHGIIERENYNKPKSPDSKQPGCPEDKVNAIEDAMRHFQMID